MISIILERVKYPHNLAAAIRAAACFGAEHLFYTGGRFSFADGERLPREERMKGYASVKWMPASRPFDLLAPHTRIVGVELLPTSAPLTHYQHWSWDTAYVFGPEDGSLSKSFRGLCHEMIYIPSRHCLNLAAAVNVVLAHRSMQRQQRGVDEPVSPAQTEQRGEITVPGFEGH